MNQRKTQWTVKFLCALTIASGAFASSTLAAPAPNDDTPKVAVSCAHGKGGGYWFDYCVHKVATSTNADVLYYFHGINGSEYEWENSALYPKIYALWGNLAPTVVTVSYGSVWLLAERNSSKWSGLYENFVNTALPSIEQTKNLQPRHRLLMGLSMGGFNAAQVYLKNPGLFYRVALACPAITTIGPYDGTSAITDYINRTHALSSYVYNALYLSQTYFPTQAAWNTAAPLTLVKQVDSSYPPLYVSGGLQDQYGFFEGSSAFVDAAKAGGAQATWTPVQGGHCTFDWQGTALFFLD